MTQLTTNFPVAELCVTSTGLPNPLPPSLYGNLLRLAWVLEEAREALGGLPIKVSSGYRSAAVNAAVGGSRTSAHMQALAADLKFPKHRKTLLELARELAMELDSYDQIILEPSWIHLGIAPSGKLPRKQLLTKFAGDARYYTGLLDKRPK